MRAHKLIKLLQTREPGDSDGANFLGYMEKTIKKAAKFFFFTDALPTPSLLEWQNLPFPIVYFEMEKRDEAAEVKHMILIAEQEEKDEEIRCYLFQGRKGTEIHPQNLVIGISWVEETRMYRFKVGRATEYFKETPEEGLIQMGQIAGANLMMLCQILNCTNVDSNVTLPDAALNKKRIKNGKLPLFEYRTLTIRHRNPTTGGVELEGDRNSPRLHLRRGHIRRHPTAGNIWVRNCVVGDQSIGVIKKDYKVT